ncbi:hypothetical protein GA0070606_3430 [Micromonospora citrea]|uniref:Uncharacterized protein n=1 Tax=Micromonospora citrea TaxID=47855 RepID=A0A1C6V534_9ACTN|nr:hypothetical protein [Micromonospora citrea]SCL61386.1 hypothetical protein GA0070606_3430 [Micromonospora citrea]
MTRRTWHTVLNGRLDHAVSAMAEVAHLRPDDPQAQALFDQFAAARPATVRKAGRLTTKPLPLTSCSLLAFAPDLSEFAVVHQRGEVRSVETYALPSGGQRESFPLPAGEWDPSYSGLVHLGDAVVLVEGHSLQRIHQIVRYRRPGWVREVVATRTLGFQPGMAAVPGAFVAGGEGEFLVGTASGPVRQVPADGAAKVLAGEPISGRIAVTFDDRPQEQLFAVLDADLRILARRRATSDTDRIGSAWFCGPERVQTYGMWNYLRLWRIGRGKLGLRGDRHLPKYELQYGKSAPLGFTYVPGHDLVAREFPHAPTRWYDTKRLDQVDAPDPFGERRFPLWISPGGEYAILEGDDGLEVADLRLAGLVTRPMAELRPADLLPLARDESRLGDDAKLVLRLLRARMAQSRPIGAG